MKLLVRRYANSKADIVGFARVGSSCLTLLKNKTYLKGILNGCEIFSSSGGLHEKIACLTGSVIGQLCVKEGLDQVTLYKNHWKHQDYPASELLYSVISRTPENIKIATKSRPREAITDFLPTPRVATEIDSENLSKNLKVFTRKASNMSISLLNAVRGAQIITGRRLVGTMWGAKKTQKYLDSENKKVASIQQGMETINMHQELMFRGIRKLQACINETSLDVEKRKLIARIVIPSIVDSYCEYKKLASNTMLEISPLLYIDEIFKNNTNYPASWFINEEVLDNMWEDFEHLTSYLGETPAIESKVIVPLDMLSSQITE